MSESNTSIEILESFKRELSSRGHMVQCIGSPWWQMTFSAKDVLNGILTLEAERDELLQKVQQLEARNAELEDLRRWRDAKKELPAPKVTCSLCSDVVEVCVKMTFSKRIASGFYDYESGIWRTAMTIWDEAEPTVIAWRPLDLPEEKK